MIVIEAVTTRELRKNFKKYADDIVEYFVQKSIANGVDILRIFDALNDVRN